MLVITILQSGWQIQQPKNQEMLREFCWALGILMETISSALATAHDLTTACYLTAAHCF
jgi:hypothetical protein